MAGLQDRRYRSVSGRSASRRDGYRNCDQRFGDHFGTQCLPVGQKVSGFFLPQIFHSGNLLVV